MKQCIKTIFFEPKIKKKIFLPEVFTAKKNTQQ